MYCLASKSSIDHQPLRVNDKRFHMKSSTEKADASASTEYASVADWIEGRTDMPNIEAGGLAFPFQDNYVNVHFMCDRDGREVITKAQKSEERAD